MKDKGPLASYEDNIAQLVDMSKKFLALGDPRTYRELAGSTEEVREWVELGYDEWVSGAWNHIDGVVKPGTPIED